jgi:hypothetical protein
MLFLHIIADYNLQGWLATAKQKSFWEQNAPEKLYKNDYICALVTHSFFWTVMCMGPIFFKTNFQIDSFLFIMIIFHTAMHAGVDHKKANLKLISLVEDQCYHFAQIVAMVMIYMLY